MSEEEGAEIFTAESIANFTSKLKFESCFKRKYDFFSAKIFFIQDRYSWLKFAKHTNDLA